MYGVELDHFTRKGPWSLASWKVTALGLALVASLAAPTSALARTGNQHPEKCITTKLTSGTALHSSVSEKADCYRFEAPSAGILLVAARSSRRETPIGLRLLKTDPDHENHANGWPVVLGRSDSRLVLWLPAGKAASIKEVSPERSQDLEKHHLFSYFLAEDGLVALTERSPFESDFERDSEEGEIDPILFTTEGSCGENGTSQTAKDLPPGLYTVLVEDTYSWIFETLTW